MLKSEFPIKFPQIILGQLILKTLINLQQKKHQASLSLAAASYPLTHYLKDDYIRNYAHIITEYRYNNSKFNAHIAITTELNQNQEIALWPDDSYIATFYKNTAIALSTQQRFWGPGKDAGLIMSTHAHGIPSISFTRIQQKAFSHRWLRWVGPWDYVVIMGQLEEDRHIPNTQYFAHRTAFKPHSQLEIGLSRAAQWGGSGRDTNFSNFLNMLII